MTRRIRQSQPLLLFLRQSMSRLWLLSYLFLLIFSGATTQVVQAQTNNDPQQCDLVENASFCLVLLEEISNLDFAFCPDGCYNFCSNQFLGCGTCDEACQELCSGIGIPILGCRLTTPDDSSSTPRPTPYTRPPFPTPPPTISRAPTVSPEPTITAWPTIRPAPSMATPAPTQRPSQSPTPNPTTALPTQTPSVNPTFWLDTAAPVGAPSNPPTLFLVEDTDAPVIAISSPSATPSISAQPTTSVRATPEPTSAPTSNSVRSKSSNSSAVDPALIGGIVGGTVVGICLVFGVVAVLKKKDDNSTEELAKADSLSPSKDLAPWTNPNTSTHSNSPDSHSPNGPTTTASSPTATNRQLIFDNSAQLATQLKFKEEDETEFLREQDLPRHRTPPGTTGIGRSSYYPHQNDMGIEDDPDDSFASHQFKTQLFGQYGGGSSPSRAAASQSGSSSVGGRAPPMATYLQPSYIPPNDDATSVASSTLAGEQFLNDTIDNDSVLQGEDLVSDVDSWAQSDARSLASLSVDLDPITSEV